MKYTTNYEKKIKEGLQSNSYYYIETFGCALNENDSMKYAGIMERMGLSKTQTASKATVILFNTCAIRENAEKKLFGRLSRIKEIKKEGVCVCIVGCMTQQSHIAEKIASSYPYVDIVLGTNQMNNFAKYVYESLFIKKRKQLKEEISTDNNLAKFEILEEVPTKHETTREASVSIIYGCNNFCSYCIVPYVRGRERSRRPEDILKEIEQLARKGYTKITLLGQNVNSYGKDLQGNISFVTLVEAIEKIEAIETINYISPHPKDFSDKLIELIAKSQKLSRQIHLPLQSGSTRILELMNRKYTKEQYLHLVEKIKTRAPQVTFSTDIIVGFPGETEEDFLETLDVVNKVKFDMIYMFCYSKRVGTRAAAMQDQVPENTKVERLKRLKERYETILMQLNDKRIGVIENVFVTDISKNNKNMLEGRTRDNKIVVFEGAHSLIGTNIEVQITQNHKWYLGAETKK